MNRRGILRGVAASAALLIAGCGEVVRRLELRTPVPLSVVNETDAPKNVEIVAFAVEDDRQTYEESLTVTPDESARLGHLDTEGQRLRVSVLDGGEVGDTARERITDRTQSIRVFVTDDGLSFTVNSRDDETAAEADGDEGS